MRTLAAFLLGIVIGAFAVWTVMSGWTSIRGLAQRPPSGIPTGMAPGGQLREFRLEAKPAKWEIAPGIITDGWTYNGQVPGPELRVREGDLVRVVVTNHLPVPTTVHWHGIDLNWKMDGVPGVTQPPIQPGETFTYEFIATPAGTRMYHPHQDSNAQLELGLYGAFIIEPRNALRYDVERTIILDERALDFTTAVAMGQAELRGADSGNGRGGTFQYDVFLMDGKAASAIPIITVKANQRILIRIINLGNLTHAMHLHGHTYRIVAKDGNPVPPAAQLRMDTVQLSPGERFDIEFVAYNPGVWMFHCHMPNHGDNGMMTMMQYEGFKPLTSGGHPLHLATPPKLPAKPAAVTSTAQRASAPRGPVKIVPMLDNRFAPASIVIRAGTTVRWLNRGQNIHTTTSLDGLWDSPGIDRKKSFSFTFAKPGQYRYLCRQHLLNGMVGTITVK